MSTSMSNTRQPGSLKISIASNCNALHHLLEQKVSSLTHLVARLGEGLNELIVEAEDAGADDIVHDLKRIEHLSTTYLYRRHVSPYIHTESEIETTVSVNEASHPLDDTVYALEWVSGNFDVLHSDMCQAIAEGVAAEQKLYHRNLPKYAGVDEISQHLFRSIRSLARNRRLTLHSWEHGVPDHVLEQHAIDGQYALKQAQSHVESRGHHPQRKYKSIAINASLNSKTNISRSRPFETRLVRQLLRSLGFAPEPGRGRADGHETWVNGSGAKITPMFRKHSVPFQHAVITGRQLEHQGVMPASEFISRLKEA